MKIQIDEDLRKLSAGRNDEEKTLIEKLAEECSELTAREASESFKDGFKLGARLMLSIFKQ